MNVTDKPSPPARKSGGAVFAVVLLLLAVVAAGAFWVMRETLDKGAPSIPGFLSGGTAAAPSRNGSAGPGISSGGPGAASTSPADAAGPRGVSPLPESQAGITPPVVQPPSVPARPGETPGMAGLPQGTAPDAAVRGGATPDAAGQEGGAPFIAGGGDIPVPPGPPDMPKVNEDPVVRLAFVDDLAAFLAANYWPKGTHPSARRAGISTVSVKWANLRYGGELQGMRRGDDPVGARAAVLRYVLTPSMLEGLYSLYSDRFTAMLSAAADARRVGPEGKERPLTGAEKKEMFQIYAGQARGLAAALSAYAADPSIGGRVEALNAAETAVFEANRAYMESAATYEEAQIEKRPGQDKFRARMDQDAGTYQRSIQAREKNREALVRAMQQSGAAKNVGEDTLVYVASWAHRRGVGNPEILRAAARVLQQAGTRLAAAAKEKP